MDSIVIVVYYNDLPNLRICLFLLNKFWKSKKKIKIIYTRRANGGEIIPEELILPEVKDAAKLLDDGWECKIYGGPLDIIEQYSDQQYFKMCHSSFPNDLYTVVFDCKDFCTREIDLNAFFKDNLVKVVATDEQHIWVAASLPIFKNYNIRGKIAEPRSPWVWKNAYVLQTKTFLEDRVGPLMNKALFPGSEFVDVFLHTKFVLKKNEFVFVEDRDLGVRQHHRIRESDKINGTACRLNSLGVPIVEIERWRRNIMFYAMANPLNLE